MVEKPGLFQTSIPCYSFSPKKRIPSKDLGVTRLKLSDGFKTIATILY